MDGICPARIDLTGRRQKAGLMTLIGSSNLDVFPLALGGNVFGWTADRDASFQILDAFTAGGGDFIDTADGYSAWVPGNSGGESETIIGEWLASRKPTGLTIATKVSSHPEFKGLSAKNIRAAAEASLKRLGVETIDLYYAHFDDADTPLEETVAAFGQLVTDGLVRHTAVSNYSLTGSAPGSRSHRMPEQPCPWPCSRTTTSCIAMTSKRASFPSLRSSG